MADKDAQARAAQGRIIAHMNADHHDSIVRYLQHYGKRSSVFAYDGKMIGIELDCITLQCHGQSHRIPIEPPMSSFREARERVVELDRRARKALMQSDVTVKHYSPPTSIIYMLEFVVISATFIAYSQQWWFEQGGPVDQALGPAFAKFSYAIQPLVISLMVVIHGCEAIYFAWNKLLVHSVNPRTAVFWLWTASAFIEGSFASKRFNDMVSTQREKQKH